MIVPFVTARDRLGSFLFLVAFVLLVTSAVGWFHDTIRHSTDHSLSTLGLAAVTAALFMRT